MSTDDLDEFTRAYIECALWSSNDESDETGGEPLDKNYDIGDLAPDALARMISDCAKFQAAHEVLLARAYALPSPRVKCDCGADADDHAAACATERAKRYDADDAGYDFWLTRCGHGAGFWDRGLGDVGDKLTDAAQAFKECWLYVGDDGKIYVM